MPAIRLRHFIAALFLIGPPLISVGSARADYLGFTAPGGLTTGHDPNAPVNLGMLFTANATFSVTSLGIYDDPGLTAPEQVGLYDYSIQAILASTTVSLTDPETDGYLFHAITPLTLTAGNEYMVVAFVGDNSWSYGDAPITNADVSFIATDYLYGSTLTFPTQGGEGSYLGPNFTISAAVPEPASLVLLGTGSTALLGLARRRDRAGTV